MNTKVNLAGVQLKNPVMTCSGTFGSGMEYGEMVDLNRLGAVVTKGDRQRAVAGKSDAQGDRGIRRHVKRHRPSGIRAWTCLSKRDIPFLKQYDTKIIVNVCGKTKEDYLDVVERLGETDGGHAGDQHLLSQRKSRSGLAFGQDPKVAEDITAAVKESGKAAGDHEAFSQCDGYHRNGKGCGGRRSRRGIPDQYALRE